MGLETRGTAGMGPALIALMKIHHAHNELSTTRAQRLKRPGQQDVGDLELK